MKTFESKWLTWEEKGSETPPLVTAETDKTPFHEAPAKLLPFPPTRDELKYDLDFVRREVESFDQKYQGIYRYWLALMQGAGWTIEEAEKGAFFRTIKLPRLDIRHGSENRA